MAPNKATNNYQEKFMQEQIMDLSGELDAEFEAYVSAADANVGGEGMCTNMSCGTLHCTVLGCGC